MGSLAAQALDSTEPCEIQPLEPFNDLRLMDMSILLDVGLMGVRTLYRLKISPYPFSPMSAWIHRLLSTWIRR